MSENEIPGGAGASDTLWARCQTLQARVATLEKEKKIAEDFYRITVRERDYERARCRSLEGIIEAAFNEAKMPWQNTGRPANIGKLWGILAAGVANMRDAPHRG